MNIDDLGIAPFMGTSIAIFCGGWWTIRTISNILADIPRVIIIKQMGLLQFDCFD